MELSEVGRRSDNELHHDAAACKHFGRSSQTLALEDHTVRGRKIRHQSLGFITSAVMIHAANSQRRVSMRFLAVRGRVIVKELGMERFAVVMGPNEVLCSE
jgi:hypothetical protein